MFGKAGTKKRKFNGIANFLQIFFLFFLLEAVAKPKQQITRIAIGSPIREKTLSCL